MGAPAWRVLNIIQILTLTNFCQGSNLNKMSALPATRLRNMDARRQRILDEACHLLAGGGTEGLTLRALAENSGVTVPTIYNLVGCKDQVVTSLIAAALDRLEEALQGVPTVRGIGRAEAA